MHRRTLPLNWQDCSGENFEDAIPKVVNLGYDTDCTVATCGAILGILRGTAGIPEKWSAPIGDAIQVSAAIRGFTAPADPDELTRRCLALYDKLALEDETRYTVTPEDNADFAVQHYVLPAHSRRDEGHDLYPALRRKGGWTVR